MGEAEAWIKAFKKGEYKFQLPNGEKTPPTPATPEKITEIPTTNYPKTHEIAALLAAFVAKIDEKIDQKLSTGCKRSPPPIYNNCNFQINQF